MSDAATCTIHWLPSQVQTNLTSSYPESLIVPAARREALNRFIDRHLNMHSLLVQNILCTYCPGDAGVRGNEQTDRQSKKSEHKRGLRLDRSEVLRGLVNYLYKDKPDITCKALVA